MKAPLVTLSRPAWHTLVAATTKEPEKEVFGYLVGRYTRVGARVHHVVMARHTTADKEHIWYANGDAAKLEAALLKRYAPLEVIGKCHSHVYEQVCQVALMPQLSDTDELSTALGTVEMITTVFKKPTDTDLLAVLRKPDEFWIKRYAGDLCCRTEAWLRVRKGKIVPCLVKVS